MQYSSFTDRGHSGVSTHALKSSFFSSSRSLSGCGHKAVEDKVHMHDLHATLLHLLGLDHEQLTYRYAGRDFRLTDVHGNVVKEILA